MKELDFDFQAGKLAQSDYASLKRGVEDKAASVLQQLNLIVPPKTDLDRRVGRESANRKGISPNENRKAYRGWQLAASGACLLLFGLALGIALTNSLRPRESSQDSMTGGFLTGTGGGDGRGTRLALLECAASVPGNSSREKWQVLSRQQ